MYVIGTAGHVDHGKSTLVHALTGIHPDRLAEEQRREMTIDLGFAHLTLPSGQRVSIIDVPGHERFIKNMLAGVGGIDAALLVVAADEGVMPQTVEHVHILNLLGIEQCLIVLTKCDLVDEEWLALVREDLRQRFAATPLAQAPMVAVSARSGAGLEQLTHELDRLLSRLPSRSSARGVPRLPIDRVFTVGGFGTVVTGTLLDGPLALGQEIEVQPRGLRGRVRGLQTHGQKTEQVLPGTRVAVNIGGIAVEQLQRGDVLTLPGQLTPTTLLDLRLQLVADTPMPVRQNMLLDLFVGAAEVPCRVTLLDAEELLPGEAGWVQLRLAHPIAVVRGDRCVLRIPSPSLTIGGGRIVDAHPPRHRRFRPDVIAALETLSHGTPEEVVLQALGDAPLEWGTLLRRSGLDEATAHAAWERLESDGRALRLTPGDELQAATWLISSAGWARLSATLQSLLAAYHATWPLRAGMPREELKARLGLSARVFDDVLRRATQAGVLVLDEATARLPHWTPRLSAAQQRQVDALLEAFRRQPFTPPARSEWERLGPELIGYLIDTGQLVRVNAEVLFDAAAYHRLVEWTVQTLERAGEVTVAGLRDQFGTSRKYALALLEHLDERKITRRVGDVRVKY
ncbi:selenocysteine-specific translation elongation factor [Kallotenue papyrolyticum]|uniref:selenocysteine-specific translation elongation factor n=1 Tax=Kallotenue papyrolyticum TaxID=1325125 RepID=UPI0004785A7B|nr:selenocysteine-specific translation elongation factor [Kallotenue papyrolyticum]